jgi:hypothetical protein
MNAAICWKEYRQQRAMWLAIGALGVLLVLGIGASAGRGSGRDRFTDAGVQNILITLGFVLIIAHGVASGAQLLAAEKEDATLGFLDTFPAERRDVWRAKALAGLMLVVAEGLLLAALGLGLGYLPLRLALAVPLVGVDALIWGMVAGAWCRNVLLAVLTGIGLLLASWIIPFITTATAPYIAVKAALALVGAVLAQRWFCDTDRARRSSAQPAAAAARTPSSWVAMTWLMVRQGRWLIVGTAAAALVAGVLVNFAPLVLYPAATLLVGLVCGVATFAPEQAGRQQSFLGAQRLPPGRVWLHRVGCWAFVAVVLSGLLWAVAVAALVVGDSQAQLYTGGDDYWRLRWWGGGLQVDATLFLSLWLVHGFCLGQFCALWATRPVIAAIVAAAVSATLSILWLPSVLLGELALWQVLGVPVLLLAGSRYFFWRWLTGVLYTRAALLRLGALTLVSVLWTGAALAYRVSSIPDVGSLGSADITPAWQDEAGPLIRRAGKELQAQRSKMDAARARRVFETLAELRTDGWPKDDAETACWLDEVCAGQWFQDIHRAARLPLGVVQDPRLVDILGRDQWDLDEVAAILNGRAFQVVATGTAEQALDPIETLLGLSRQFRNHAPPWLQGRGSHLEGTALTALATWLETARPSPDVLRRALVVLARHERQRPGERQALLATYLVVKNTVEFDPLSVFWHHVAPIPHLDRPLWLWAWQAPWEAARQDRLGRLVYSVWLQQADKPYWELEAERRRILAASGTPDVYGRIALECRFPPAAGPGADWSPERWGRLLVHSWPIMLRYYYPGPPHLQMRLRGELLTTALLLYRADKGRLPEKLEDLVPDYLTALPLDPFSGKAFQYRVSAGESLELPLPSGDTKQLTLAPGQGFVWSAGKDTLILSEGGPQERGLFPVPTWK